MDNMALIENKKAGLKYEILEKFEAGIELLGAEVKSLRTHRGSLLGAHIIIRGGEAYLVGANIPPYQPANAAKDYDPERNRKLLLTKKEIAALAGQESKRGLTIVPISMYNKGRKIKISLAVGRGKKKYDKRETLKRRSDMREMERTLKRTNN
ncbi:MAG: SsrA-binding protein SmpB [Patescibacteria group bacterium]